MFGTIRFIMAAVKRHTTAGIITDYGGVNEVFLHLQSFGDSAQAFGIFVFCCMFDKGVWMKLKNRGTSRNGEYEEIPCSNPVNADPNTSNTETTLK
jgi:hypothetical protein